MTIEEAKEILRTYRMPLTKEQIEEFKQALQVLNGFNIEEIPE